MSLKPQHVAPELLTKVTKALGITALDQWYHVSHHVATRTIGLRALNKFGGTLASFLKYAYPQHHFDEEKLAARRNQENDQKFIEVVIRKLFPNVEIQTKARKAVGIVNPETDAYLEIDFWMPSLKLGIEYQDKHHYGYQWYANQALEDYQKRDDLKKAAMPTLGYTLINIGYWWDKTIESVAATIREVRPDLLQEYKNVSAKPIPSEPPAGFIIEDPAIPGVAGIMSPFVPRYDFDPTNWYAGEKQDGIRGIYNPELNKMFSRSGAELSLLPALLQDIPNMIVEGEIVAGRGNYGKTAAVSNHTYYDKVNWPIFRYVVYDIPDAELGNYTQRYSAIITELFARPFVFSQSTFRVLVESKVHLKTFVDAIISDAGEGVIAQQDSPYEYGRAKGLAKIKVRRDADAQVLSVNKNSCTCKLVSGVIADISFCDSFDSSNLKVGDVVSYYYNGYSQSGLPKRGEIYRIRYDMSWEKLVADELQNVAKRKSVKEAIGSKSLMPQNTARNKMGHWNKSSNVRAFFNEYARISGFDPLIAENWYLVKNRSLLNAGAGGLLYAYGTIKKALTIAYPELSFDNLRTSAIKGHWRKSSNARSFFDEFARKEGFNPLIPKNWYPIRLSALHNAGGGGLLSSHDSVLKKALSFAYPEVMFEEEHFRTIEKPRVSKGHWNKSPEVRTFFDEFAQKQGFDPRVPENWYSVKIRTLRNAGGSGMLSTYKYNVMKALASAYPELKFEEENFRTHEKTRVRNKIGHWTKSPNVRAFFDEFAQTTGFDPLVSENWKTVQIRALRKAGGGGLLNVYGNNIKKALSSTYPELKFDINSEPAKKRAKTVKV